MPKGIYQHKKGYKRPPISEKWRENLSKSHKGKRCPLSDETRKKISESNKGKKHSEESKRKMSEARKKNPNRYWLGKKRIPPSEETRRKIGLAHKGNKYQLGKKLSEETKRKISEALKGHPNYLLKHTEETKRKISKALKGEKSSLWKGGISKEPYSIDWTNTLKKAIKERDKYTCKLCGNQPERLFIHHINYVKKNCNPDNLITLCCSCHTKTNFNRDYWIKFFGNQI